MNIEMGKTYWKIDNTTATFEALKTRLKNFGITEINHRSFEDEFGFKRISDWKTQTGMRFSTIWFVNLCTIRFGDKWDDDFGEVIFDEIQGAYLPYCDHDTIEFVYKGVPVFKLALRRNSDRIR